MPAVVGTTGRTDAWNAAGQSRTVLRSDGSSAQELLTKYEHPHYFSYKASGFTSVLRFPTMAAHGQWWFNGDASPGKENKTNVRWRYAFRPKSYDAAPVLWFITNALWRGYRRKALALCKTQVEEKAS